MLVQQSNFAKALTESRIGISNIKSVNAPLDAVGHVDRKVQIFKDNPKLGLEKLRDYIRTLPNTAIESFYNNKHYCWDYTNNKVVSPEDFVLYHFVNIETIIKENLKNTYTPKIKLDAIGLFAMFELGYNVQPETTWDEIVKNCFGLDDQSDLFWFLFDPNYDSKGYGSFGFTALRIDYYLKTGDYSEDKFKEYMLSTSDSSVDEPIKVLDEDDEIIEVK